MQRRRRAGRKERRAAGGPSAPAVARAAPPPRSRWSFLRDEQTRFGLSFAIIAGGLLAFYYFPRSGEDAVERWTASYLWLYTRVVGAAIGVFDPGVTAHGNVVAGRFSMQIVKSCDAMEANILFTAAVLAFSAPWRRKVVALLAGLSALVLANLVRLFVLYWVGVFAPSTFDFLHYDVWPLLLIAFAAVDFLACVRWARRADAVPLVLGGVEPRVAG
jgi:exosortase/archaeosortase family protein